MMRTVELRRARLSPLLAAQAGAPARSISGALSITGCKAYAVREPASRREYAILRIDTGAGVTGWGETRSISPAGLARAAAILKGRQATEYVPLHAHLSEVPDLQAATNMALLDIVGKAANAPVYQVLGGPTRHKTRALVPLAGAGDAELIASLKQAQAAGFRAFLVPAVAPVSRNSGQVFVAANRKRLEALRAAGGDDSDFVIDCRSALTPGDASSLSDAVERLHPLWLDEPCELTNLAAIRKIASERVTPLGFGRSVSRAAAFQDLLREDLIDVFRPDLARHGITQIKKFAALAEANYIAVAPYHDGGPIGTAAALHLAASLPNFFIQQLSWPDSDADRRFRNDLAGGNLEQASGGYLNLPSGPGLGLHINESMLGKEVA